MEKHKKKHPKAFDLFFTPDEIRMQRHNYLKTRFVNNKHLAYASVKKKQL